MSRFNILRAISLVFILTMTDMAVAALPDSQATYLLSNASLKKGMALTVGVNNALDMTPTNRSQKQLWKFKATDNGYYRITNLGLGDKHSLENDSQKLIIGPTRKYSGQLWKLKQMGNGNYRLTNMYKSRHSAQTRYYKVLDTDKNSPHAPSLVKRGNSRGQYWKLTKASAEIIIEPGNLNLQSTSTTQHQDTDIVLNQGTGITTELTLHPDTTTIDVTLSPSELNLNPNEELPPLKTWAYGAFGFGKVGTSRALCGLPGQEACGYESAKLIGNAVGKCPAGSFFDLTNWSCWSCPQGYERSAAAIHTERACRKPDRNARGEFGPARFVGKLCSDGSFFDPIRDGECFSCPAGYNRSAAHIDMPNACYIPQREDFKAATRQQKTIWPHECRSGTFFDGGGGCFTCPSNYKRTAYHINDSKGRACSRLIGERHAKASVVKKAQCGPGEIKDAKIRGSQSTAAGGGCWVCPTAWDRTVNTIDGNAACEKDGGFIFAKATEVESLSCPKDQVFDLISTRDPKVSIALQTRNTELTRQSKPAINKGDGATCWQCSVMTTRSHHPVYANNACDVLTLNWETAAYTQRGLFGLRGAEQVALDLVKDGKLINTIATDIAPKMEMSAAEFRKAVWDEIATVPEESDILKVAIFSRLVMAAEKPGQATAAEKQLLISTGESLFLRKFVLGIQAQANSKNLTRPFMPSAPRPSCVRCVITSSRLYTTPSVTLRRHKAAAASSSSSARALNYE